MKRRSMYLPRMLASVACGLFLVSVGAWTTLRLFGPWLITAIYDGRSLSVLNVLITGQRIHPLSAYLTAFEDWLRIAICSGVVLSIALAGAALVVRAKLHRQSTVKFNVLICLVTVAAIAVRDLGLLIHPRFWAEEGAVHFQSALDRPLLEALFAPHQGYLSILANMAGILATLPPLEYAPLVTTVVAFFVQLSLVVAIALSNAPFLKSGLSKALASAAVLLVGSTGEIWLTTANSSFYFPILVFLILCHDKSSGHGRALRIFATGFSGLASVTACVLLPWFLARYFQRRQTEDRTLFVVLAGATLIQVAAIAYSRIVLGPAAYYHPLSQARFGSMAALSAAPEKIIYYALQYPLLGTYSGVASLGVVAAAIALMVYTAARRGGAYWHFLSVTWMLTLLSVLASLGMNGGPRYAYAPSVIFALFLLAVAFDDAAAVRFRSLAVILFSIAMMTWIPYYRGGLEGFSDPSWPTWEDEVRAWRSDSNRSELQIHPDWEGQRNQGLSWVVRIKQR